MSTKAGLDSAVDFTKFVITLDSALIAFLTGATFLTHISGNTERVLIILALALLALSLGAGVLTQMRAATMLSSKTYDLGDQHLKVPGAINVLAFAAGAILVGAVAAFVLVVQPPVKNEPAKESVVVVETAAPASGRDRSAGEERTKPYVGDGPETEPPVS